MSANRSLPSASVGWITQKGLLIKPNHPHQCDATDVPIFSLDIDPNTSLGEWIIANVLKDGEIKPNISERFPILETAKANRFLETGNISGKIVLLAPELN